MGMTTRVRVGMMRVRVMKSRLALLRCRRHPPSLLPVNTLFGHSFLLHPPNSTVYSLESDWWFRSTGVTVLQEVSFLIAAMVSYWQDDCSLASDLVNDSKAN